jgi:hypothetical protein
MKKILLGLLLMAASTQLKAQQLAPLKPDLKLNDGLQNLFKPKAFSSPKDLLLHPKSDDKAIIGTASTIVIYSNMPVVKIASTDRMPILTFNEPGVKYTMLIKKVEINPAPANPAQQP